MTFYLSYNKRKAMWAVTIDGVEKLYREVEFKKVNCITRFQVGDNIFKSTAIITGSAKGVEEYGNKIIIYG